VIGLDSTRFLSGLLISISFTPGICFSESIIASATFLLIGGARAAKIDKCLLLGSAFSWQTSPRSLHSFDSGGYSFTGPL